MKVLRTIYRVFCILEETIVALFIASITFLVFFSALARSFGRPINWAVDVSLLLLAWVVFLGADTALRRSDFIRVDILMRRFPQKLQKFLYYLYYVAAIMFLGMLVRFGIPLSIDNYRRTFQTLQLSYSWATMSVVVGAFFMIITILIKLVTRWKESEIKIDAKEAF